MTDEGVVTKYRYDELDRLLEAASNLKAISYEYDRILMPYTRRGQTCLSNLNNQDILV